MLNAFKDFHKKFLDQAKRTSNVEKMKPSSPEISGKRKRKDVNYANM